MADRRRRSRRPRFVPVPAFLLALALLVLAAPACSSDAADTPATPRGPETAPSSLPPDAPSTTDPPGQRSYHPYWIRDCAPPETAVDIATCRLVVGSRRLAPTDDYLGAAMQALRDGPDEAERAAGMGSNIRPITSIPEVVLGDDGVATVSVNRYFETAKTRPQTAQVVFTLTQFPEVEAVRILVDGEDNGAVGVGPLTRDGFAAQVPSVLVEDPAFGQAVAPTFRLAGTTDLPADAPPATFSIVDAGGTTLTEGTIGAFVTKGGLDTFDQVIALPGPVAAATIVVTADDGTSTIPFSAG